MFPVRLSSPAALVPVVAALWLSACAESSVLPPATPSPLPEDKVGRLGIACPTDTQAQSLDGRAVTVDFEAPVMSGGQQPVTAGCSLDSGGVFGIGSTPGTCWASDALQQTASCDFQVTVLGPPKLAVTRFLAFGDSITAGVVSSPGGGRRLDAHNAYPARLQRGLASAYMTQDMRVINTGRPGEHAAEAVGRFNSELARHRPDVVLLMEGTNDLYGEGGNGAERAAAALEQMVASARAARVEVVLMTIPPQRNRGALVVDFNERIRSLAGRRDAVFADVHRVLLDGPCSGLSAIPCIGSDGLHPTAQGHELMAQELERVLVERYDVEIVPTAGEPRGDARGVVVSSAGTSVSRRRPG